MSRIIMLVPVGVNVGLTTVTLGLLRALERQGIKVNFFKPIAQLKKNQQKERTTSIVKATISNIFPPKPFALSFAEDLIARNKREELLEKIVEKYSEHCDKDDVVVVEGLVPSNHAPWVNRANIDIAKALSAEVVFVASPTNNDKEIDSLISRVEVAIANMGGKENKQIKGVVVNKIGSPKGNFGLETTDLGSLIHFVPKTQTTLEQLDPIFLKNKLNLLGVINWSYDLIAPRVYDVFNQLGAKVIHSGKMMSTRLKDITFCARSLVSVLPHLKKGSLLVTSADRPEIILATSLCVMNGVEIGALLLTGGFKLDDEIYDICKPALKKGLPIALIDTNTWQSASMLQKFNLEVPLDDKVRIEKVQEYAASGFNEKWIESLTTTTNFIKKLSPSAFRHKLTMLARKANKKIVLPEGDEPRTIQAAIFCAQRKIAKTVLLGEKTAILNSAKLIGIENLEDYSDIEIIESKSVLQNYVAPMVELRKKKGLTEVVAKTQLEDNVVLGTMVLAQGEVDGLVSGAVHTTANTIRPPLQLIKTSPNASLVSSIFFMLLPDQVLIYGDCAINPDPSAKELAEIAIQSADSAVKFGIEPKVAMISYSTGTSGTGDDVDKVREATKIAKEKRPDLLIDGPLQYDAAIMENVAASKAPNSPVAGKATVFIFPDLNTGNTTYKAVQRSANLISIGPMLQGMKKPVNDLSRGALIEDIVYTIALTAIQS